jgi:hypothetical protein
MNIEQIVTLAMSCTTCQTVALRHFHWSVPDCYVICWPGIDRPNLRTALQAFW